MTGTDQGPRPAAQPEDPAMRAATLRCSRR